MGSRYDLESSYLVVHVKVWPDAEDAYPELPHNC